MTAQEAISIALRKITRTAQEYDRDYPNDSMELFNTLPIVELERCGFIVEVLDENDADILPHLRVQSNKGRLEVERCPFAPLVLLSDNASWDGAEIVTVLNQVGITALKIDDFESVPDWYGIPSVSWLFPQRLSEVFSRLDTLRERTTT